MKYAIEKQTLLCIALALQNRLGTHRSFTPIEMADAVEEVYEAGKLTNVDYQAGKQAEYDAFWDALQQRGYLRGYHYMFFTNRWNDNNYNPKYPIVANNIGYGFAHSSITNTLVDIDITPAKNLTGHTFDNAIRLKTIPKLIVSTENTFDYSFQNCTALENITIEGTIANNINFQWSPLTVESMKNIIRQLKSFSGDGSYTKTITFSDECKTALEQETDCPIEGLNWLQYADLEKGWNVN